MKFCKLCVSYLLFYIYTKYIFRMLGKMMCKFNLAIISHIYQHT